MASAPTGPSKPQSEMRGINRSLDELTPKERDDELARPGGIVRPLIAVALVIIAMLIIAGWLLIGTPSQHSPNDHDFGLSIGLTAVAGTD